jgi:hypothetical protein
MKPTIWLVAFGGCAHYLVTRLLYETDLGGREDIGIILFDDRAPEDHIAQYVQHVFPRFVGAGEILMNDHFPAADDQRNIYLLASSDSLWMPLIFEILDRRYWQIMASTLVAPLPFEQKSPGPSPLDGEEGGGFFVHHRDYTDLRPAQEAVVMQVALQRKPDEMAIQLLRSTLELRRKKKIPNDEAHEIAAVSPKSALLRPTVRYPFRHIDSLPYLVLDQNREALMRGMAFLLDTRGGILILDSPGTAGKSELTNQLVSLHRYHGHGARQFEAYRLDRLFAATRLDNLMEKVASGHLQLLAINGTGFLGSRPKTQAYA